MRRIIAIFLLFISLMSSAQLPEKVKYVEFASAPKDTMIMINKPDLDKINTTFYRLDLADSLNVVNEEIISNLTTENNTLKNISDSQKEIIENQKTQMDDIQKRDKEVISDLESQVKRANTEKTFSMASVIALITAILFAINNR